jgi:hypothetical protein
MSGDSYYILQFTIPQNDKNPEYFVETVTPMDVSGLTYRADFVAAPSGYKLYVYMDRNTINVQAGAGNGIKINAAIPSSTTEVDGSVTLGPALADDMTIVLLMQGQPTRRLPIATLTAGSLAVTFAVPIPQTADVRGFSSDEVLAFFASEESH